MKLHPVVRHLLVGLAAAALIGAAAGCSNSDSPDNAPQTSYSPLPTDISSVGQSTDPNEVGDLVRAAMSALTSYRMEIQTESQVDGRTLVSSTSIMVDLSDPAVTKVKSVSVNDGQTIVMMQIGSDIYTKLPNSDKYQHSTTSSAEIPAAGGADQLFTQAQQVRLIGDDKVDGQPVTHYLLLDTGATIDVYADAQHRVVKSLTTTQPADPQGAGGMGRSTVQITWHDFDQPQDIAVPDASEIAES